MTNENAAYNKGYRAGSYSENPYDVESDEFDLFERGRTQAIKRSSENGFFFSGWDFDDEDPNSIYGSKDMNSPEIKINKYARAKGKR